MAYTSDITLEQFALVEKYLPKKKTTKPRKWSYYELFNAMLYILVGGSQWRNLPNDLPPWKTVHHYFLTWSKLEIFDEILKKTLKNGDYNKVKINIQLYYSQIPKARKIQIGRLKT
jgi:transposase